MTDKSLQTVFSGSALLLIGTVLQLAFGFFTRTATARYLGSSEYGMLTLGITLVSFLSTICLFGMDIGVARFLPRFDNDRLIRGVLVSAFSLSIPIAVFVGGIVAIFPHIMAQMLGAPNTASVLRIFGLAIPFAALLRLAVGGARGLQRVTSRVLTQDIVQPVTRLGLLIVVILAGGTVLDVSYTYLIAYVLAAMLAVAFLAHYSILFDRGISPTPMRKRLVSFSAPLIISSFAFRVLSTIDVFLLSIYIPSTRAVGVYQAVYPLAKLLGLFAGPVGFILLPVFSELDTQKNHNEMQQVYQTAVKWIFILTLPVALLFIGFPQTVIKYTFGSEYAVAGTTLVVLSVTYLIHAAIGPNTEALTSVGASRIVMADHITAAVINIGLNAVLIPRYSYFGAAIATITSFMLLNIAVSAQLYRRINVIPISDGMVRIGISGIGAFAATVWAVTFWFDEGLIEIILATPIFGIIYTIIIIQFGIGNDELALFESMEHRFGFESTRLKQLVRRVADEK